MLGNIDNTFLNKKELNSKDDIYYTREAICFSLEGRRIDLITISSYYNISNEREVRLKNLFPEEHIVRPFRFIGKKVRLNTVYINLVALDGTLCSGNL